MKKFFREILLKVGTIPCSALPAVTKAIVVMIVSSAVIVTTTAATSIPESQHEGVPVNTRTSTEPSGTVKTPNIIFSNFVSQAIPGTVIKQELKKELRLKYEEGKSKVGFLRIDMADITKSDITSAKLKFKLKGSTADFTNVNVYLCGVDETSGEIINETKLKWNTTLAPTGLIGQNKRLLKPNDAVLLEQKNTEDYIELDFTEFARTTKYLKYIRDDYFSQTTLSLCLMADSTSDLIFATEVVENNQMIAEIMVNGVYTPKDIPTIPLFGLDDPALQEPPKVKPPIPAYEDAIAYGGFESTGNFILKYPIDYDSIDIDPSVPEYPETVNNSEWAPLGYVDVTLYGADPTGTTDSTEAIRNAIKDAYDYNMATYVPEGTYLISDTLDMYSPKGTLHNIRRRGSVMVGSTIGRTTFKLTDNNPAFDGITETRWQDNDETIYLKPLIYLWVENNNNPGKQKDNENYNNILRNITIDLGNGNPGAVGVRHRGCEGSSLENITIYPREGFAGVFGMLGSGGIMSDITVDGGKYGIYSGGAQPVSSVVGFHLMNQTEMAIYYKETSPLILVGGKIEKDGGVFIGGMDRALHSGKLQEGSSLISLYDVSMENTSDDSAIALENSNRGIYGINVYTKGIDTLVSADDTSKNVYLTPNNKWKHIEEFSWAKEYTRPMGVVDGVGVEAVSQNILKPDHLIVPNSESNPSTVTKNITENNFVNEKYPGTTVNIGANVKYLGISNKSDLRRTSFVRIDMSDLTQNQISKAVLKLRLTHKIGANKSVKVYLCGIDEETGEKWAPDTITWNNTFAEYQAGEGTFKENPELLIPLSEVELTHANGMDYFEMDFTDFARETTLVNNTLSLMICTDSENPLKLAYKDTATNPVVAEITTGGSYTPVAAPTVPLFTLLDISSDTNHPVYNLPPSDLVSRHVYPYKETSIDWLEAHNISYANIKDYGAVGDGITDDTDAFKNAVAENKYIFIPRGVYKITETITLKSDIRLFGVSRTISIIRPVNTNETLLPAFKTPNDSDADCIMSSFKVLLPSSDKNVAGILWQSGKKSIIHGMWVMGTVDYDGQTPTYWIKVANNGGGRIYSVVGIGQFDTNNTDSRLFLVENTSNPLFVYHLHSQHVKNDQANAEIRNSENVVIFSAKSEVTYGNPPRQPAVVLIKDSNNVLLMGYGGNYSATNGDGCVKIDNSDNVTVCNMGRFMPHRNGQLYYYYVFETKDSEDFNSVDAEDYLNYYKRGQFSYISVVD